MGDEIRGNKSKLGKKCNISFADIIRGLPLNGRRICVVKGDEESTERVGDYLERQKRNYYTVNSLEEREDQCDYYLDLSRINII